MYHLLYFITNKYGLGRHVHIDKLTMYVLCRGVLYVPSNKYILNENVIYSFNYKYKFL